MEEQSGAIYSFCSRTGARDQTIDFWISCQLPQPPEPQPPREKWKVIMCKFLSNYICIIINIFFWFTQLLPPFITWYMCWRGLLCMSFKRNLTQIENNSLHCHAWVTLYCSTKCGLWLERWAEYSDVPLRVSLLAMPAFDWLHPMTIMSVPHIPAPIIVKQQEERLYGLLIVTKNKEKGGWMKGERNH